MRSSTGGRRGGNLPGEVTGFVGREAELARLRRLLGVSRLVTVTGTGGVGKTRVALRAAATTAVRRGDVYLVELSDLRGPGLLGHTVATALGLHEPGDNSGLGAVLRYLRDRSTLLILDTCEHLLNECAGLTAAIMDETARVTVLATSRQPLDVPGEAVCPLAPLPADDSLTLFEQRGADAVPGFAITGETRADAIRLCRRLDGVPLAIELAAVRLRALPLRDLADRLDQKFQLLNSARPVTPDRHQTLHGAIAWSYDLCSDAERVVWARLSVFAGSFDIRSAEEVCAGRDLDQATVTQSIIGLVDKSVVLRTEPHGARYRLLDTIREFGAQRLAASGDEAAVRGRHVARYLALAREFRRHFAADDQLAQVDWMRLEHANIRAALEYSLHDHGPQHDRRAADLGNALYAYWQISGRLREGRHWLGQMLERVPGPGPERARALIDSALLGAFQGSPVAVGEADEGTRIAEDLGHERLIARGHLARNIALAFAGRYADALEAGEEAQRRLSAVGSSVGLLCLDAQMGLLLMLDGQFDRAVERCELGLRGLRGRDGERWLRSYFHGASALALYHEGGKAEACAEAVRKALTAKFEIADIVGGAFALEVYAWLAADVGRGERAAWLLGAADALWRQAGTRLGRNRILERSHQRAAEKARDQVPAERFDALFADGAARPWSIVVTRALADADTLDDPDPAAKPGRDRDVGPDPAANSDGPVRASLTPREWEVADLVSTGLSNREIAEKLVISPRTVDAHVDHIFTKIGISSRLLLAALVRQHADPATIIR